MRIAFDLDGVLADLHGPFVRTVHQLFPQIDQKAVDAADVGASPPDDQPDDAVEDVPPLPQAARPTPLTRRQSDAVWRTLAGTENFWEGLKEIEDGLIARLASLADERGWEILFITSRPRSAGRTVQRQSQHWLAARGFPLPSVYVVHGSRGKVADALAIDVVVDDRPDNCLDVVLESRAAALLVWRGSPATVPASAKRLGIAVVPTVARVLEALVETDRRDGEGSLLQRLRSLFGLRTRSQSPSGS
jgi:hypothetical protein